MTGKNDTNHGGGGRGQGDIKKHTKDVADKSKFPRLTGYFSPKVPPKGESSSSGNDANDEPAGKRPRPGSTDIAPPSTMAFSKASEPPDIAPAASSYLLGKGGIISQAVSALKSGLESLVTTLIDRITTSMRTETNHLSAQMRREMKELIDTVDHRRDLLRNEQDLFASSQKLASNRHWLMLLPTGRYCCGPCTSHTSFFKSSSHIHSPWLLCNGAVKYNSDFSRTVCKHETSHMHDLALELDEERACDPLEYSLQHQLQEGRSITAKLFRTVYSNTLHYRAFLDYENVVWLQHNNEFNIGEQLHSRCTAPIMLEVIYNTDRAMFTKKLSTIDPATNNLPHVGSAADKVSDLKFRQWQCNAMRLRHIGSPVTACAELSKMGLTAKGQDCYDNLIGSLKYYGVIPRQRRTYSADGEAVYSGEGTTANTVKSLVKAEDEKNEYLQDPPHSIELLQGDMREKFVYVKDIHELIQQVYTGCSSKGKKVAGMEETAKEWGCEWYELHYIFAIRMTGSEYVAIKNFMGNYPVLIHYMEETIASDMDSSNASAQLYATQCKHWVRKMKEFKFVAVTLLLLDHDKNTAIFSKASQGDDSLALDYPSQNERYKDYLLGAQGGKFGSHVKRNLGSLKKGMYAGIKLRGLDEEVIAAMEHSVIDPDIFEVEAICGKRKSGRGFQYLLKWCGYGETESTWEASGRVQRTSPGLVEAFERGDSTLDQQAASRDARARNRDEFREPEEAAASLAALEGDQKEKAEKAIEERLQRYAAGMAGAMLEKFDQRLPIPEVLLHLREVYDFRRMPLDDIDALRTWSDESVKWLVQEKFPWYDVFTVQSQALKVRMWLFEVLMKDPHKFHVDVPVHNSDGDVIKGQSKRQLALCGHGDGSIYNEMFTNYDSLFPSGITEYLDINDYNISFMFTQCATERIGRNMTLTKPPARTSLSDKNFKMAVWVSYNGPPIHEVDFMKYVDVWVKEGHQSSIFKSGGESKILERKGREHKHTILCDRKEM